MAKRLSENDLEAALNNLSGWTLKNGKLHKAFAFSSFNEAFGFLCRIALYAERINHHPELFNSYTKVTLDLTTHDVGSVSELDIKLAKFIDTL